MNFNFLDIRQFDFHELHFYTIFLRILLSLVVGGIIGLERGIKSKSAGFRTYMLVCLGSAMVMMTNQYIYDTFGSGDPTRMGAQVVSGIGFLGAGTILVTHRNQIRGLTTAAGLWVAACLGLAIGIGFYTGAVLGGITVLFILTLFEKVKILIEDRTRTIDCYIIFESATDFHNLLKHTAKQAWKIIEIESEHSDFDAPHHIYEITFQLNHNDQMDHFMEYLEKREGILFVKKIRQ
ncbi:MgtC/SapB family protein [Fundicoccus sp. Sow4_D5]|uniref:MgtC/SapB family protein n=1 Tax=Fundicoccus sp. Sow4_D5 TaxID=3438782 RepID=UPI003F93A094